MLIIPKNLEKRPNSCLRFHSDKGKFFWLRFSSTFLEAADFEKALKLCQLSKAPSGKEKAAEKPNSLFDSRTEKNSADLYFQFYAYLNQQQNMLQDFVRTSTYQQAILSNTNDFSGKVRFY